MAVIQLTETEKAICQLLIQYGVLEDSKLENLVREINADLKNDGPMKPLKESFVRINANLRPLSFEIKSVVKSRCKECNEMSNTRVPVCSECSREGTSEWAYFHGMANTEECETTKNFGSDLAPEEIKFFSDLVQKLLDFHKQSTNDIYNLFKNEKLSGSQIDIVLEKLRLKGWIQRDRMNFWEIGVRTYLECKQFLENVINNAEAPDDEDEEEHAKNVKEQLADLLQVATY